MSREIVLDTETTGLSPREGHRVVEIGCVEIINRMPTGRSFHRYIHPERDMPAEAMAVHGLTAEFLRDHPVFAHVVEDFLSFIADDPLVIHNAAFDTLFLNFELTRLEHPPLAPSRIVDSLMLARRRHPGGANSLDALCSRYAIDGSRRKKHGALLDAELLSEVYAELTGGRQASLTLAVVAARLNGSRRRGEAAQRPEPLPVRLDAETIEAHREFVGTLGPDAIWNRYMRAAR